MRQTVHLEPSQVPAVLRGGYSGKFFKVEVSETVFIPSDAGVWDHGSRETYRAVNMATGEELPLAWQHLAPWDRGRQDHRIPLRAGVAVVSHRFFCGKDMGLRIYICPADAVALLPPAETIADPDATVLAIIRSRKPAYRLDEARREGIDRATFEAARERLIASGHLTKAGAITVKGRNAVEHIRSI